MNSLEIYIVYHDQASFELFKKNNSHIDISKFKFILVGDYDRVSEYVKENHIVASFLPDNIEQYKSLLTFTAWYALSKNNLIKSEFVGIFEYDCVFERDIFELENISLSFDSIIGFSIRSTNEKLFLDLIPEFCALLSKNQITSVKKKFVWNATTNVIMPSWFLDDFVNWYEDLIPQIIDHPKHSHYHERAINVLAAYLGVSFKESNYVRHKMLCSHGIKLQK